MLQHSTSLFGRNALEPLNELQDRGVVFEVLEQRRNGHPRPSEDPRAAQHGAIVLHSVAG